MVVAESMSGGGKQVPQRSPAPAAVLFFDGEFEGSRISHKTLGCLGQHVLHLKQPEPNPPDHASAQPPRPQPGFQRFTWPGSNAYEPAPDETQEAIVQVHGWNMTDADRRVFSATFFKRLWWKGYKGRYAAFAWPTYNVDDDSAGIIPAHYNKSEYVAWKYGPALRDYVNSLGKPSRHVAAHSMGNVVMASALLSGLNVSSYVAMQAAIPSGCYDASDENNRYEDFIDADKVKVTPDASSDFGYRRIMTSISGNLL